MEIRTNQRARRGAVTAALAISLSALVSATANAQTNNNPQPPPPNNQPAPAPAPGQGTQPGPSALNPGGVQGQPNGGQGANSAAGSQTQGTPSGAAAQGESATAGSRPATGAPTLPPLNPQQRTPSGPGRISVTSSTSLTPIISRAQDMLRVAETRRDDASSGARQSYVNAARSLRQMLSTVGYSAASSNVIGAADRMQGVRAASLATFPVESAQITDDIMLLRAAARQSGASGKMIAGMSQENLQKVASLYATGAKEFFTGQLRDALFDSPVTVSMRSRTGSQPETRPSDLAGAAAGRSDRPDLPFEVHLQSPGNQETNVGTAGSSALPGEGGNPTLGAGVAAGPVGLGNGAAAVPPNLQFAAPGFYGGFYGPPAAILGGYPGTAGFPPSGFFPGPAFGGVVTPAPAAPTVPVIPVGP